jgi:hypothetical protein
MPEPDVRTGVDPAPERIMENHAQDGLDGEANASRIGLLGMSIVLFLGCQPGAGPRGARTRSETETMQRALIWTLSAALSAAILLALCTACDLSNGRASAATVVGSGTGVPDVALAIRFESQSNFIRLTFTGTTGYASAQNNFQRNGTFNSDLAADAFIQRAVALGCTTTAKTTDPSTTFVDLAVFQGTQPGRRM